VAKTIEQNVGIRFVTVGRMLTVVAVDAATTDSWVLGDKR